MSELPTPPERVPAPATPPGAAELRIQQLLHELRTPLTAHKLLLQLLSRHAQHSGDATTQRLLVEISGVAERMERLVQDLAAEDGLGHLSLHLGPCDLLATVRQTVNTLRPLWPERHICLHLGTEDCVLQTDGARLQQVLTNLVTNALKFSETPSKVHVGMLMRDQSVRIFVRDTGIGLAPEDCARVFTAPHTLAPQPHTGMRLGLPLCAEIVAALGGQLRVWSRLGAGSVFWVELPRGV